MVCAQNDEHQPPLFPLLLPGPAVLGESEGRCALRLVEMARCSRLLVADLGINLFRDWKVFLVVTGYTVRDARMEVFKNIVQAGGKQPREEGGCWFLCLRICLC